MEHEVALSGCADVRRFEPNLDAEQRLPGHLPELAVVIARYVDDPRRPLRDADQLAEQGAVRLQKRRLHFHSLEIDDVADQVDRVGGDAAEKVGEIFGAGGHGPDVDIGQPEGPEVLRRHAVSIGLIAVATRRRVELSVDAGLKVA